MNMMRDMNKAKYSESLKSFAMTLNFYSPKAYNFVRKEFNNLLSNWFSKYNGRPGFTMESIEKMSTHSYFWCLIIDEIHLKKELVYKNKKVYGYSNMGEGEDCDNTPLARTALFILATSINGPIKLPIGYFLIDKMNSKQLAEIINNCLCQCMTKGVGIKAITFDGLGTNISMCKKLGANFKLDDFRPYFMNQFTDEKIHIFLDPSQF